MLMMTDTVVDLARGKLLGRKLRRSEAREPTYLLADAMEEAARRAQHFAALLYAVVRAQPLTLEHHRCANPWRTHRDGSCQDESRYTWIAERSAIHQAGVMTFWAFG